MKTFIFSLLAIVILFLPNKLHAEGSPIVKKKAGLTAFFEASRVVHVICNGGKTGEAEVTVTGGTPPYQYMWSASANFQITKKAIDLTFGRKEVMVQDANGNITTASVTITQPKILKATFNAANVTDVKCKGEFTGKAIPTVTGGTTPYNYIWSNGQSASIATNLKAGSYSLVIVDVNGCTSHPALALVDEPHDFFEARVLVAGKRDVSCFGKNDGSCKVYPINGTGPFFFEWSTIPIQLTDSATNLTPGMHTVKITDADNCVATKDITIIEPTVLTAWVDPSDITNPSCAGYTSGVARVKAVGGTKPYSYWWNTSPAQNADIAIDLAKGTYTASVTDGNNCVATTDLTITTPPKLEAKIEGTNIENVLCHGNPTGKLTVEVTGGVGSYRYRWTDPYTQTSASAVGLLADDYTVFVYDGNDCETSTQAKVSQPAGALSINAPFEDIKSVQCYGASDGQVRFEVSDGTPPYTNVYINSDPYQSTTLNPAGLSAYWTVVGLDEGTYTATAQDANGCLATTAIDILEPDILSATFTPGNVTHVACKGGTNGIAQVTVNGGTLPYTYQWSHALAATQNVITGVPQGNYEVIVRDVNNCTTTSDVDITEPENGITAFIDPSDVTHISCFGLATGNAKVTVGGGTPPYNIKWGDPLFQTGELLQFVLAGDYTATVSDANNCPEVKASTTITEPTLLQAAIDPVSVVHNLCYGDENGQATVMPSGGTAPYTYQWNDPLTQKTVTATDLPAEYWEVLVRDARNCWVKAGTEITQPNDPLSVQFKSYDVKHILCHGDATGKAKAQVTGGTIPYTFAWSTLPAQNTLEAIDLTSGVYQFTVTDNNNCEAKDAVEITQPEEPLTIELLAENISHNLCYGDEKGAVSVQAHGGTRPYHYRWDDINELNNSTISLLPADLYTVTVSDGNECEEKLSVDIVEPDEIKLTVTHTDIATCFNDEIGTIQIDAIGGVGNYEYSIDNGNSYFTNGGSFTKLAPGSNYFPLVRDGNGCKMRAPFVDIISPPEVKIEDVQSSQILCYGDNNGSITITASGGTGALRYSIDDGVNFQPLNGVFTGLAAATYPTYVSDDNNCQYRGVIVELKEPTPLDFSDLTVDNGCNNADDGYIRAMARGGYAPYTYSLNGGAPLSSGYYQDLAPGSYAITITDFNKCTLTTAVQTINNPESFARFTADTQEGCSPLEVNFTNHFAGMKTYLWSFGDGGAELGANPVHFFYNTNSETKQVQVTAKVQTTKGCLDEATMTINILGAPRVEIDAAPYYQTYPDATVLIEDFSSNGFPSYLWNMGDGTVNEHATQLQSQSHTYGTWGEYFITLGVSNQTCSATDTTRIMILPPHAVPQFNLDTNAGCVPLTVNFTDESEFIVSYEWNMGDGTTFTQAPATHTYTEPGTYQIVITAMGHDGVEREFSKLVTVYPLPQPEFAPLASVVFLPNAEVVFENKSVNAVSYKWNFGDGTSAEISTPTKLYTHKGSYTVTLEATSEFGCKNTIKKTALIEVNSQPLLIFPNAFTPSPAGSNGGVYSLETPNKTVFHPKYRFVELYKLTIHNKWGAVIFETEDIKQGWDGYHGGKLAPMGVYVWRVSGIFQDGMPFQDVGNVTLIR